MKRLAEEAAVFLVALGFLTRLPVPDRHTAARMAATPRWYPGVGVVVGALSALVWWGSAQLFSPAVAAILAVAAGILVTGALHEDGFADLCDGLGGAVPRDRALEIMRDSRLGSYGAAGLVLMLGLKVAALAALPGALVPWALIAGHAASRAAPVLVMARSRYLRAEGTAAPVARAGPALPVALATAAVALLPLTLFGMAAPLAALLGLGVGHVAMRRVFERRLGGYTGDCLGAVQQTSEVGLYLGLLAAA